MTLSIDYAVKSVIKTPLNVKYGKNGMNQNLVDLLKACTETRKDTELAHALGLTPQAFCMMKKRERITPGVALRIELVSGGLVRRHQLLPELFAGYLPVREKLQGVGDEAAETGA